MSTIWTESESVHIPVGVEDHASFRRWAHSDEFPETGRVCFLDGDVWVDRTKEQLFTHNQVKNEFAFVLTGLVKKQSLGRFFPDGVLLTNPDANLTCQPDGTFVSAQCLDTGRVRLVEGARDGYVELEGTPDMVLEVVSNSSVMKDTLTLVDLYWKAGIREYWIVDAREEEPVFEIFRREPKNYVPTRKSGGWLKSRVFNCSFQLTRQLDAVGHPEFTLGVR